MHSTFEHLDLFSGIGGFAIAARAAGFVTVAFCEADERCQTFLEKTWGKPVHPDIRTFDAKPYRGISLLTGGPPCQPASRAGKQGGAGDDRWLWPQALRVLGEAAPDCVVFENPPGIGDVGLDGILSEMGRIGYEVQVFDIPACAVDSPQLRHRFWIVGFRRVACSVRFGHEAEPQQHGGTLESRQQAPRRNHANGRDLSMADPRCERSGQDEQERGAQGRAVDRRDCENELADTGSQRHQERGMQRGIRSRKECSGPRQTADMGAQDFVADSERERRERRRRASELTESRRPECSTDGLRPEGRAWSNSVWVPCADGKLRRAPDDSFGLVDGLHRSLLAALGNSISPQVAIPILRAAREALLT